MLLSKLFHKNTKKEIIIEQDRAIVNQENESDLGTNPQSNPETNEKIQIENEILNEKCRCAYVSKEEQPDEVVSDSITVENEAETNNDNTSTNLDEPVIWQLPSNNLLQQTVPCDEDTIGTAKDIEECLTSFGFKTTYVKTYIGPEEKCFAFTPEPGKRINEWQKYEQDIALSVGAENVTVDRILGEPLLGIRVRTEEAETIHLADFLAENINNGQNPIVPLGVDSFGNKKSVNLRDLASALIAGQTGSGKSMFLHSCIISLLMQCTPDYLRMILVDTHGVELQVYNTLPHMVAPVICKPSQIKPLMDWLSEEVVWREKALINKGFRDIYDLNVCEGLKRFPYILLVVEKVDLLSDCCAEKIDDWLSWIAQNGQKIGIYVLFTAQRPSTDLISKNLRFSTPIRISFALPTANDSKTILDQSGAEKLAYEGDMLYKKTGYEPVWMRVPYVSDEEISAVVAHWKQQRQEDFQYLADLTEHYEHEFEETSNELDDRLAEAVEIVVSAGQASVSLLQREMRCGYARCGRLIDEMEKRGIVGEADGAKPRKVLMTKEQFRAMFGEEI